MSAPTDDAPAPRRRRPPLAVLTVLGALLGGLLAWGVLALVDRHDTDGADRLALEKADPSAADTTRAANDFLAAWARYRHATYTATLEFSRVASNGQSLQTTSTFTQAPPRRIVRQGDGSVLLTDGAASRTCNTLSGALTCVPAPAVDYEAAITTELESWRTAVLAEVPYYRVSVTDPGCFQLELVVAIGDPPYGRVAQFCFDEATGALLRRQLVRDGATDTEEATSVSPVIPADAFTVPAVVAPTTTR